MSKTIEFDLIVEGRSDDPATVAPPTLEFFGLKWAETPPDVIVLEGGTMLIKVGRYASSGNRYQYRLPTAAHMRSGQLS
jgi:hypothetical protein